MSSTLNGGRRAGFAAIAGNATGILVHTAAAAAGVAALIASSPTLFEALRTAGAIYLLYLAYRAARSSGVAEGDAPPEKVWLGGVTMSLLNPKITLLMLALLPQFVDPEAGSTALQAAALGVLHASIASTVLTVLTLTGIRLRESRNAIQWLRWGTAGALGGFGLKLVFSR